MLGNITHFQLTVIRCGRVSGDIGVIKEGARKLNQPLEIGEDFTVAGGVPLVEVKFQKRRVLYQLRSMIWHGVSVW